MANQQDIENTYDYMDELFRFTIGEHGDVTCALYNGDFSKSLAQAQQDKHDYILDAIHFKAGARVLDIGCATGYLAERLRGTWPETFALQFVLTLEPPDRSPTQPGAAPTIGVLATWPSG